MEREFRTVQTQVIGAGSAGLAIAVAADRLLGKTAFEQGIGFTEASPVMGSGNLAGIRHNSNSPALEFADGILRDGLFAPVFDAEYAMLLKEYGDKPLPLWIVGGFLGLLGQRLQEITAAYNASFSLTNTPITHIVFESNQSTTYTSYAGEHPIAHSQNLVLATGAREVLHPDLAAYKEKVVFSADVAKNPENAIMQAEGGPLVILGGSHSAFAVGNLLHSISPDTKIVIAHRNPVKNFYNTREEADRAGYRYTSADTCPIKESVYRFGGIRNDAKEFYGEIREGRVTNVTLHQQTDGFPYHLLDQASLITQALGYTVNMVPIFDIHGRMIGPKVENRTVAVDQLARISQNDGTLLPNAYAIGLGHGLRPNASIGGEPSYNGTVDGVNVSYAVGQIIVKQFTT